METALPFISAIFGLIVGSFLNVCIVRLPKEESVVTPRSHCPKCGHMIPWYENIPLASYLFLRGKCHGCGTPISPLYFVVELTTGVLFGWLAFEFGATLAFLKYITLCAIMLALTIIDLRDRVIPDELTLPGFLFGVGFSIVIPVGDGVAEALTQHLGPWPQPMTSVLDSLLGAAVGAGTIWVIGKAYYLWRHKEGMGFGDVTLMGVVGTFLGVKLTMLTMVLGSISGSVIGTMFIWLAKEGDTAYELPFGSFLGPCAMISAVWGKEMIGWYTHFF